MVLKIKMQCWSWHITMGLQNTAREMVMRRWILTFSSSIYYSNLVSHHLNHSCLPWSRIMSYLLVFSSGFYSMLLYVKIECLYLYQIAIGTDDVYKSAEAVKQCGGKIIREPGPIPVINTKITACLDPDGWKSVCFFIFSVYLLLSWFSNCIYKYFSL